MGTKDVVISEWLSDKVRFADLFNKCSKNSPTSSGTPLKKSLFCIKQYNIKCFYLF